MKLGKIIRFLRNNKKITQTEMSKKIKISVGYLSQIEQEKRNPRLEALKNIAEFFEFPLWLLIFYASEEYREKDQLVKDIYLRITLLLQSINK